jgi:hypothetical protein
MAIERRDGPRQGCGGAVQLIEPLETSAFLRGIGKPRCGEASEDVEIGGGDGRSLFPGFSHWSVAVEGGERNARLRSLT